MRLPIFQLDAFADAVFAGNPAAVVPLPGPGFLPDTVLQAIAAENNLAETAFLIASGEAWRLRWFTPAVEVPLCGHATLAAGAVVLTHLDPARAVAAFDTLSGRLTVTRAADGYAMDLPARALVPAEVPGLAEALGAVPDEVYRAGGYLFAVHALAATVRGLSPDLRAIARLGEAVCVTAPGDAPGLDFVSRFFAPAHGVDEDPVTGSAHCGLAPYWAARLGKTRLSARQVSPRGGDLVVEPIGDRVRFEGRVALYLEGVITV